MRGYWAAFTGLIFGCAPLYSPKPGEPLSAKPLAYLIVRAKPIGGKPTSLYDGGRDSPLAVTVNGTFVYWCTIDGLVMRAPQGGGASEVLAEDQRGTSHLAVDSSGVYLSNSYRGVVAHLPPDGGPLQIIADGQEAPGPLVIDHASVYWVNRGNESVAGSVVRASRTGGATTVLAAEQWFGKSQPGALLLSGQHLYWTVTERGEVVRMPISGGAVEVLARNRRRPLALTTLGDTLYWSELGLTESLAGPHADAVISAFDLRSRTTRTVARDIGWIQSLVSDGTCVYWSLFDSGAVLRDCPGSAVELVVRVDGRTMVTAPGALFLANFEEGQVQRVALPSAPGR